MQRPQPRRPHIGPHARACPPTHTLRNTRAPRRAAPRLKARAALDSGRTAVHRSDVPCCSPPPARCNDVDSGPHPQRNAPQCDAAAGRAPHKLRPQRWLAGGDTVQPSRTPLLDRAFCPRQRPCIAKHCTAVQQCCDSTPLHCTTARQHGRATPRRGAQHDGVASELHCKVATSPRPSRGHLCTNCTA